MKTFIKTTLAAAATLLASTAALADITIGASLPLTGPGSGLGIPMSNGVKMWPATIGRREGQARSSWTTPPIPPRACRTRAAWSTKTRST
jgi:hypothetical protein